MKAIKGIEQRSDEWRALRRCKVTGSRLADVMGTSLARVQLIAELIAEEASEMAKEIKPTKEMEHGIEQEPFAVAAFSKISGREVSTDIAFMISDEFPWLGFSPDGVIKEGEEMIEIKNPDTKTSMFYRLTNEIGMQDLDLGTWKKPTKTELAANPNAVSEFTPSSKNPFLGVPSDYKYQVLCGFIVNEMCKKIHFVIHDERIIDEKNRTYIVVINRDEPLVEEAITETKEALIKFREDWINWKKVILPSNF